MRFSPDRPIFQQVADGLCADIIEGRLKDGDRVPSVRDMAVSAEVNPNTVARAYALLQDKGVIATQRGLGYFLDSGSREAALSLMKEGFLKRELEPLFRVMELVGIGPEELSKLYAEWRAKA
jgi:GntR family transcriptional regulator